MEGQGNYWKIGFFSLLALIIIGANGFAWYYFVKGKAPVSTSAPLIVVSPVPSTETITITPSPSPTSDETPQIEEAIFNLTGLDPTKVEITVNKNTGQFATGDIKELEAVGGAYWLAAKVAGKWMGVYAGQASPTCNEISPYNFPKDMVPECLDNSNNVIQR